MIIDAILDHLTEIEYRGKTENTKLSKEEIDYIKKGAETFDFEYITKALELDPVPEYTTKDYEIKKAFCRYIIEQNYNLEIIPRISKITWL